MLELALAGWVNATRPAAAVDSNSRRPTRRQQSSPATGSPARPAPALVAGLLREVGAADLADDNDLITSIAQRLPDVAAGRFEI